MRTYFPKPHSGNEFKIPISLCPVAFPSSDVRIIWTHDNGGMIVIASNIEVCCQICLEKNNVEYMAWCWYTVNTQYILCSITVT